MQRLNMSLSYKLSNNVVIYNCLIIRDQLITNNFFGLSTLPNYSVIADCIFNLKVQLLYGDYWPSTIFKRCIL